MTNSDPSPLVEQLGDNLHCLQQLLVVAKSRANDGKEAAHCLELPEIKAKMVDLHRILQQTDEIFSDPAVKEWIMSSPQVPF